MTYNRQGHIKTRRAPGLLPRMTVSITEHLPHTTRWLPEAHHPCVQQALRSSSQGWGKRDPVTFSLQGSKAYVSTGHGSSWEQKFQADQRRPSHSLILKKHLRGAEPLLHSGERRGDPGGTVPALMDPLVRGEDRLGTHVLSREAESMLEAQSACWQVLREAHPE